MKFLLRNDIALTGGRERLGLPSSIVHSGRVGAVRETEWFLEPHSVFPVCGKETKVTLEILCRNDLVLKNKILK